MAGTKQKKGQAGNAVQYLTRNQALKKLQLKLAEFRRLCILKGIHPREPKKKVQGQNKTYYHVKDINYLLHEPLLKKIRELYAYEKKVRKAGAKKNQGLAARLAERRPTYRLDHLVRERYPSFVDALRDLDDPLTILHLFAVLPAEKSHGIPAHTVQLARRLVLEWQAWVVRAHALRKVFVSVKGYYYQAEVMGQAVTWLVPHQLSQVLPSDVDYRVMLTFLEFYQTLVQFVNFKLYHSLGLRYPPVLDPRLEQAAAGLAAVMKDLATGAGAVGTQQIEGGGVVGEGPKAGEGQAGERGVNPEAAQRMASLSEKVKQMEKEIRGERPREEAGGMAAAAAAGRRGGQHQQGDAAVDGGSEDDDEEDEGEGLEIDSGAEEVEEEEEVRSEEEEEEEQEEEESSDDEGESGPASDPEDADIELAAAPGVGAGERGDEAAAEELVGGAADVDADDDSAVCSSLFKGLVFFLGREVPREQLMMVIRAFGGEVAWDGEGSPFTESSEVITHQVVDRPTQGHRFLSREYVQPQWLFDSANFRVLVKPQLYAPGRAPPPHLSPFVVEEEEGYMPEYGQQLKQLQEAAHAARKRRAGALIEGNFLEEREGEEGGEGRGAVGGGEEEELVAAERRYAAELAKELKASQQPAAEGGGCDLESEDYGGLEGEEDEEEAAAGGKQQAGKKKQQAQQKGGEEAVDDEALLKDVMMTRKTRKLYQSVQRSREAKRQRVEALQRKARGLKQQQ